MNFDFFKSVWKQRIIFFVGGLVFSTGCFFIGVNWIDVARWLTNDSDLIYDEQPSWLKKLDEFINWLPLIAVFFVLILRFVRGKQIKIVFFFLGTLMPFLWILIYMLSHPIFGED